MYTVTKKYSIMEPTQMMSQINCEQILTCNIKHDVQLVVCVEDPVHLKDHLVKLVCATNCLLYDIRSHISEAVEDVLLELGVDVPYGTATMHEKCLFD